MNCRIISTSTLATLGMCLCDEHTNTATAAGPRWIKENMQTSALQIPRFTANIPKKKEDYYYYYKGRERYQSSDC